MEGMQIFTVIFWTQAQRDRAMDSGVGFILTCSDKKVAQKVAQGIADHNGLTFDKLTNMWSGDDKIIEIIETTLTKI